MNELKIIKCENGYLVILPSPMMFPGMDFAPSKFVTAIRDAVEPKDEILEMAKRQNNKIDSEPSIFPMSPGYFVFQDLDRVFKFIKDINE